MCVVYVYMCYIYVCQVNDIFLSIYNYVIYLKESGKNNGGVGGEEAVQKAKIQHSCIKFSKIFNYKSNISI